MPFKQHCDINTCTGCNSMHSVYNKAASRWCYEDRFGLKRQDNFIRAKINYKDTYIQTGIIEHHAFNGDTAYEFEQTFKKDIFAVRKDNYKHLIEETCKTCGVTYSKFIRTMQKIKDEMGFFYE